MIHIDKHERTYLIIVTIVMGVFFASLLGAAVVLDVRLPSSTAFVNPRALGDTEFAHPGLRDMGNGNYDLYVVAQMWRFNAGDTENDAQGNPILRLPVNSTVTFYMTATDVQHGIVIERHNINMQIVPGQVSRLTSTFTRPGIYRSICHEFCGRGHQGMFMTFIIEDTAAQDTAASSDA